MRTVPVELAGRAYDVVIGHGLLAEAGRHIKPHLKRERVVVVSDETVWGLHGAALTRALEGQGITREPIVLPPANRPRALRSWKK